MIIRDKAGIMKARVSARVFHHLFEGNQQLPGKWRPYKTKDCKEEMVFEVTGTGYYFGDNDMKIYLWEGDIFINE